MTSARAKEVLYDSETMLRLVANELNELRDDADRAADELDEDVDLRSDMSSHDISSDTGDTGRLAARPSAHDAVHAADEIARQRLTP